MAHTLDNTENPMTTSGRENSPNKRMRRLRLPSFDAQVWTDKNPLLQKGEIGIEQDTRKVKLGDGITYWNDLAYSATPWGNIEGNITAQEDLINYVQGEISTATADMATQSGNNNFTGNNSFNGNNTFAGNETHSGSIDFTGNTTLSGNNTFSGNNRFTTAIDVELTADGAVLTNGTDAIVSVSGGNTQLNINEDNHYNLVLGSNAYVGSATADNHVALISNINAVNARVDDTQAFGPIIGSYWFGFTGNVSGFTIPDPISASQNYFDFTTNTPYTAKSDLSGWTAGTPITLPDHDARIIITSKFWDIVEDSNLGGIVFWSDTLQEWSYYPTILEAAIFAQKATDFLTLLETGTNPGMTQADTETAIETHNMDISAHADIRGEFDNYANKSTDFVSPIAAGSNLGITQDDLTFTLDPNDWNLNNFAPGASVNGVVIRPGQWHSYTDSVSTTGSLTPTYPGEILNDVNNLGHLWDQAVFMMRCFGTPTDYIVEVLKIASGRTARAQVESGAWRNWFRPGMAGPTILRWFIDDVIVATNLTNSSNTNGWYRMYISGWVEQGGVASFSIAAGAANTFALQAAVINPLVPANHVHNIVECIYGAWAQVNSYVVSYTNNPIIYLNSYRILSTIADTNVYRWMATGRA